MHLKLFVCLLTAVVGLLTLTSPVAADAAMTRCDVEAIPPQEGIDDPNTAPRAYIEGWLTCDPAILPDTFNNTVCLQIRNAEGRWVDIHCCKVPGSIASESPWLMCGEPASLFCGTQKYRTRARAFRPSTARGETDYSPAVIITITVEELGECVTGRVS